VRVDFVNRLIADCPTSFVIFMKRSILFAVAAVGLLLGACKDKPKNKADPGQPKPVAKLVEAEAANLASDALFAIQVRDFARAEASLARAVKLRNDIPDWWVSLGSARKRQGKNSDARAAYKEALSLFEDRYDATKDPQDLQQQLIILVLLGKEGEARKLLDQSCQKRPDELLFKQLKEGQVIDQMLRDPIIQQMKL